MTLKRTMAVAVLAGASVGLGGCGKIIDRMTGETPNKAVLKIKDRKQYIVLDESTSTAEFNTYIDCKHAALIREGRYSTYITAHEIVNELAQVRARETCKRVGIEPQF